VIPIVSIIAASEVSESSFQHIYRKIRAALIMLAVALNLNDVDSVCSCVCISTVI
jgi:hypothetical protein